MLYLLRFQLEMAVQLQQHRHQMQQDTVTPIATYEEIQPVVIIQPVTKKCHKFVTGSITLKVN